MIELGTGVSRNAVSLGRQSALRDQNLQAIRLAGAYTSSVHHFFFQGPSSLTAQSTKRVSMTCSI